jgi:hypothetical protein
MAVNNPEKVEAYFTVHVVLVDRSPCTDGVFLFERTVLAGAGLPAVLEKIGKVEARYIMRPFKNVQSCSRSRKAIILSAGIY